jgi:hypothetical protein
MLDGTQSLGTSIALFNAPHGRWQFSAEKCAGTQRRLRSFLLAMHRSPLRKTSAVQRPVLNYRFARRGGDVNDNIACEEIAVPSRLLIRGQ